ncbi:hypothetical protein Pmani_016416 [Petrolisthes manimaculis]|uniref:Ubiquitin-like domain-containing protein n=1 Tax=Petrolisthes manimaculis TaxID=1843537 RepID=A0AAE1U6E2_9EUCA|nr:hypothetical protein Pmani_016416 [Petrolisthes manimaculis]
MLFIMSHHHSRSRSQSHRHRQRRSAHDDEYGQYVEVRSMMGQVYKIPVYLESTKVKDLKMVVESVSGVAVNRQILVYQNHELENHHTLLQAGISDGSTIKLILNINTGFCYF